jgi:hypothetical protein
VGVDRRGAIPEDRTRGAFDDWIAVTDEYSIDRQSTKGVTRWREPEEGDHLESALLFGEKGSYERVRDDERSSIWVIERRLLPTSSVLLPDEFEPAVGELLPEELDGRVEAANRMGILVEARGYVDGDIVALGETIGVAAVAVRQHDHARDGAERIEFLVESPGVERVNQPDIPVDCERVTRAPHPFVRVSHPRQAVLPAMDDRHLLPGTIVFE